MMKAARALRKEASQEPVMTPVRTQNQQESVTPQEHAVRQAVRQGHLLPTPPWLAFKKKGKEKC